MEAKKAAFGSVAALLLIALVLTVQIVEVAEANFFPGPALVVNSPISGTVYTNTSIPLNVIAMVANPTPEIVSIMYCLDGDSNVTLTNLKKTLRLPGHIDGSEFCAESVLENLTEGNHTLNIYSRDASGGAMSTSVKFRIDTHYKSPLSVLSPQNTTYITTEVPLIFVCTEEIRRTADFTMADYILDGMGGGPISGNLTLTNLSLGNHTLMVIVWTANGTFSETINFNITNQTPTPVPTPTDPPTLQPTPTTSTAVPELERTASAATPESESRNNASSSFNWATIAAGAVAILVTTTALVLIMKQRHRKTE
ncbi:MAG: hypothetical protein ACE14S_07235 [Candidatus Bathyarchaeia archaeon]